MPGDFGILWLKEFNPFMKWNPSFHRSLAEKNQLEIVKFMLEVASEPLEPRL